MRQTPSLLARPVPAFLFGLTLLVVTIALALALARRHEDRLHLRTGPARWIWPAQAPGEEPAPLRFFAAREFEWSGAGSDPARALLFVDRSYAFFLNGAPVGQGRQKPGDPLDAYDASSFLRGGRNRILIRAESPDGAGGILFLLTLPDGRTVASDKTWRAAKTEKELESGAPPVAEWGRPPMYPWGYPKVPSSRFNVQSW